MNNPTPYRGYIALMMAIIISFTLTAFAIASGMGSLMSRVNLVATEQKWEAEHYARSCITAALLHLTQDSTYHTKPDGVHLYLKKGFNCTITAIEKRDEKIRITAFARKNKSTHTSTAIATFNEIYIPVIVNWER